jgi:DNA repair protein RadC
MIQAIGELARAYAASASARHAAPHERRGLSPLRRAAGALRKEQFHVILLDGKNRPLKDVRVSEGR